jgi:hypothetical protein
MRLLRYRNIHSLLQVEVHITKCIVSQPPLPPISSTNPKNCALINSGNTFMVGTALSYFPTGGPVPLPPPPDVRNWGGMDIGGNQLYGMQVVDGVVWKLGGQAMQRAMAALPIVDFDKRLRQDYRCQTGGAVLTPATEGLQQNFSHVIHTVSPFASDPQVFAHVYNLSVLYYPSASLVTRDPHSFTLRL